MRDTDLKLSTRRLTVGVVDDLIAATDPTRNSPIICDEANRRVYVVNPDNDSVTAIDADTENVVWERPVGKDPRAIAKDSQGYLWVTCFDADRIDILNPSTGGVASSIPLPYGSAPYGIAPNLAGDTLYVTLYGAGKVAQYNAVSRAETDSLDLGPTARGIAVMGDESALYVTRFISEGEEHGEVWKVNLSGGMSLETTIELWMDPGVVDLSSNFGDTDFGGRGLPNYLESITISPDGLKAWVTGNKYNVQRGLFADGQEPNEINTLRAVVCEIDLTTGTEDFRDRRDVDNSASPKAVEFSPRGDFAFVALEGNNQIAVYDRFKVSANLGLATVTRLATGLAPQGLCYDSATRKLFSKDFMGRSVTVFDVGNLLDQSDINIPNRSVDTVTNEVLSAEVLNGKQIFYNAEDTRMGSQGYVACATCHVDGAHDGRTWDFTNRGEGLRNTTDLRGRRGTGHGNVHWTANFDEIQDFENDIRGFFGGTGFMSDTDFAATEDTLGAPKAGLSSDLDDLSAYVTSLQDETYPRSPYRNADGTMTEAALAGSDVFVAQNCVTCHVGPDRTDSTLGTATLHDVGSLKTGSGTRLRQVLAGIDTPTLNGLWAGAPYMHDGSAPTIHDVFATSGQNLLGLGGKNYQAEAATLLNGAQIRTNGRIQSGPNSARIYGRAGGFVNMRGGDVEFTVDGGSGGNARLVIRVGNTWGRGGKLFVNGTDLGGIGLPGWGRTDGIDNNARWMYTFLDDIVLQPGNNTILLDVSNTNVDEIFVSNADDIALSAVHTAVSDLAQADYDNLIQYLLQLDGREPDGNLPVSGFAESGGIISMEAENGTLGSRWQINGDANSSGAQNIEIDPQYNSTNNFPSCTDAACISSYTFSSAGGNYAFWFRTQSSGGGDDSFFWRIDDGPWVLENGRSGFGVWFRRDYALDDGLSSGQHVLQIASRENGTKLDKFVIQLDSRANPQGDGPAETRGSGSGGAPQPPLAPSGLAAMAVSTTSIEVSFQDNSTDEDAFEFGYKPSSGSTWTTQQLAMASGTGPMVVAVSGLTSGTSYDFRVRAVNAAGSSAWVGPVTESTLEEAVPSSSPVANIDSTGRIGWVTLDSGATNGDGTFSATLQGDASIVTTGGRFDGAVRLDGTGQVNLNGHPEFNTGGPYLERTISVWFAVDDATAGTRQLIYEEGGNTRGINAYLESGILYVGGWDTEIDSGDATSWPGTWKSISGAVNSGQWHHVAIVLDASANPSTLSAGVFRAYLDGQEFDITNSDGMQLSAHVDAGALGGVNGTSLFHAGTSADGLVGYIDDLAIWNRVLSSAEIQTLYGGAPLETSGLLREYWTGISGTAVSSLTGNSNYPDSPTGSDVLTEFQAVDWNNPQVTRNWADNYGQRVRGYIQAPVTGEYVFFISGDDENQLWLSPDTDPANAVMVAHVPFWSNQGEWGKYLSQRSTNNSFTFGGGDPGVITLQAGQFYYVEALMKEGGGGDSLNVGWLRPGETGTAPSEIVPNSVLTQWGVDVASPSVLDFSNAQFDGYSFGQDEIGDGDLTVLPDKVSVQLTGNTWKSTPLAYTLTPNTVLEMEVTINTAGELIGIGFDNDSNHSNQINGSYTMFVLDDTHQSVPSNMINATGFLNGTQATIPIGQFLTGTIDRLTFMADDDRNPSRNDFIFRNVSIYEQP